MGIPRAEPEQRGHIQKDIIILLVIVTILCCLAVLLVAGGYFFYQQYDQAQSVSGTATSAYMATKVKQDTEAQATIQAETSATAQALSMQATATAQALEIQTTATAQALQAQATATAQAKNAELMAYQYYDPFDSNTNDWRAKEEDNDFWSGETGIQNGIYRWEVTEVRETFVAWSDFNLDEPVKDFDVAIKARRQTGKSDEYCYGLLFRKSMDGFEAGSYTFSVCENGYISINYYDGETKWEKILDWTETSAIYESDWNLIEIKARGADFTIYINSQQVAQFSDERLPEGMLSIFIDVYEKEPGQIEFDFFALQQR